MTLSAKMPGPPRLGGLPRASPPRLTQWLWRDRLLLGAFALCGLLISYQLGVTLLQPAWIGPVTDWLRAALAWPELLVVVGVAFRLSRARPRCALSFWMLSVALLSYTVARTLWTVADRLIFSHGVPFPTFPDLFFVLQYPFFFLAVILIPSISPWGLRLKIILDSLLWTGGATALSWYFILAPIFMQSGISPLAKLVCLAYPVGDLVLLFGLVLALLRSSRSQADRVALYVLCSALVCLILADSWVDSLLLVHPRHVYVTGHPPDLFWLAFYLLLPLASLVRLRLAQREPDWNRDLAVEKPQRKSMPWGDLKASLRFSFPLATAVLVSSLVLVRGSIALGHGHNLIVPLAIGFGLLLLVIVRQEITFLENARLRREREAAHAAALALQQTTEHMDEFIATAGHDLRTPIGAMVGYIDLASCACHKLASSAGDASCPEVGERLRVLQDYLDEASRGATRVIGVLNLLFATAQARGGGIELHEALCDLRSLVREQVAAVRMAQPQRTIHLQAEEEPSDARLIVLADAERIGQVVANYLTNALKYSAEDQPVEVSIDTRMEAGEALATVAVRDHGPGVPLWEQDHIWKRFYRAQGIAVRSGTNIGLGLGLHMCKMIVDQHGGQVGVESELGSGSAFWFTLPLVDDSPASPASS